MPTHDVNLDFNKTGLRTRQQIVVRVGDTDTQVLRAHLYDNGIPYTPKGTLRFQVKREDGGLVRSKPMTKESDSVYTCVIPSPTFTYKGEAKLAYVAEYSEDKAAATTSEVKLIVLPGTTDEEAVRFYDEELEELIEDVGATGSEVEANEAARQKAERERASAEESREAAEQARVSAESARDEAEQTRTSAETARDTAEQERDAAEQLRVEAETQRETDFEEAQNAHQQAYEKAEEQRNSTFSEAESQRQESYEAVEKERADAEEKRAEAESSRVEAEDLRAQAETSREEAESARVEAETARDTAEKDRDAAEQLRAKAETEREEAEESRSDAEASRVGAETDRELAEAARSDAEQTRADEEAKRKEAEAARVEAETARDSAEDERAQNEIERRAAEDERDAAETLRSDAEASRAEAETKRATAEQERETAEDLRVEAEDARAEAEQSRVAVEEERVEAETARDTAEQERDTAEKERKHYEDQRRAAEIQRQKAEVQRNANETTRKRQEDERVVADELRTQQQAKNNADQAANNLAAQGQQRVFLVEDQYDPVTRVPTLEGEFGIIYCVPRQDPEEIDQYIEWIVTYGADGSKRWERVGTSDIVLPDPITTDQIDQIVDNDEMLQGTELQNASSLSYFWQKIKAWVKVQLANIPAKLPDPRALRAKLAEANEAKEAAVVAGVGSDYEFGTWVTQQADYDTFCAAIDEAQAHYDEHYSQEELDDATQALDEALRAFKAASHEVVPDKSAWDELVETYTAYSGSVFESDDGSDVPNGEQWVTPAEQAAYDAAYEKANGEVESATKQSQIDSAVADLTEAETTYESLIKTAETSTDALSAAIEDAKAAKKDIQTSEDGSDIYDFYRWVTPQDLATFDAAIQEAESVVVSGCSQDDLDAATETLNSAKETFEAAIKDGLRHIQYDELDSLIEESQSLLSSTATSETEGADVSIHVQWTTQEVHETFDAAIKEAQRVRSEARTQEAIDDAKTTLQAAKEVFEAARKPGLMPIDLQELDKQLAAARKAMSDTYESTDGSDVPNGKQWTTSEHRQTLQAAITEAERIRSESTQQDEVDTEAKTLEAAISAYNATLQTAETSTTALSEAIEAATQAKSGVVESADGTDVYESGRWVTHEQMATFDEAIETAQGVLSSGCSQDDLDAAVQAITEATSTFQGQIANGTKIDYTKLDAALTAANAAKADVQTSADGKDIEFGSKWATSEDLATFTEAIETAQGVRAGAANQAAADEAATTLEAATETFTPQVHTAAADTAALETAIQAANTAKDGIQTSDQEGEDLDAGSKYVTTEQMETFNAAIQAATTAKTESTTQAQLDEATSTLTAATETFSSQIMTNFEPPENIADASWEDIEQLSALAAESPQDYTKYLGQTKTIDLSGLGNGCTNVTAMVIGIGQDVDPQGKKLGLTFQLRDGLPYQTFTMNSSNTTTGGWRDSLMRSTNLPKVKAAMPEELSSRLKTMVKKTHITDAFNQLVETQDDLALLSQVEVWGNTDPNGWNLPAGEGEQYQWYAQHNTNNDRIIKRAGGSANDWWLRSVYSSTVFRYVGSNGTLSNSGASVQYLPCACFSV